MDNKFLILEIIGFIFVTVVGTLMHFIFDLSGRNSIAGVISPVNESTWEHLKLLFFPMLVYTIFEFFSVGKNYKYFLNAKSSGMLIGMITIVVVFYTYKAILGKDFLPLDILTFILGVAIAFAYSYWAISNEVTVPVPFSWLTVAFVIMFVYFTFYPPHRRLFLDPVTNTYGIPSKS